MRWIVLLLALGACTSSWTSYESGDDIRPQVAAALRAHDGRAGLVAHGRAYVIPKEAAAVDLAGFTAVLADAIEAQRYADPREGRDFIILPDPDLTAVVSYAYPDRRLELTGPVTVQGARRAAGYFYWVSFERREREHLYVPVQSTPAIDRAWSKLVRGAQAASRPAAYPPTPLATMGTDELVQVMVDLRGR